MKKNNRDEERLLEYANLYLDDEIYDTDTITPKLAEREESLRRCQQLPGMYLGNVWRDIEALQEYKALLDYEREKKRKEKSIWERKTKKVKRKRSVLHRLMEWSSLRLEISVGESK